MNKFNKVISFVSVSLLLAACGGGGGGGSDGSEKPTEPTRAAGLYMTAINNPVSLTVKSVASSNRRH